MYEKVNMHHPDKVADRIAGAIVDLAYSQESDPKIAVEVLIGHGVCHIITESSVFINPADVKKAVKRIAGQKIRVDLKQVAQNYHLAANQIGSLKCGDNGVFKGTPVTDEQRILTTLAEFYDAAYQSDGKYVIDSAEHQLIVCQSCAVLDALEDTLKEFKNCDDSYHCVINPLGFWTGGIDVDTGATNRKLGSDMGDSVTGGGLHGKDLSKADVSVNIYCWLKAQELNRPVEAFCSIGDRWVWVDGAKTDYNKIIEVARDYIKSVGGFEAFAEYGLIR